MHTETVPVADDGKSQSVQLRGFGFRMIPAGGPACFPRTILIDGKRAEVISDDQPKLIPGEFFTMIAVGTVTPAYSDPVQEDEVWTVEVYESECDWKLASSGSRAAATRYARIDIAKAKALATAAPGAGSVGFAVPDAWVGGVIHVVQLDVTNTGRQLRKWLKASDGTWYPAGLLDPSDKSNDVTQELIVRERLDTVFLQIADATGQPLSVDIRVEVPL